MTQVCSNTFCSEKKRLYVQSKSTFSYFVNCFPLCYLSIREQFCLVNNPAGNNSSYVIKTSGCGVWSESQEHDFSCQGETISTEQAVIFHNVEWGGGAQGVAGEDISTCHSSDCAHGFSSDHKLSDLLVTWAWSSVFRRWQILWAFCPSPLLHLDCSLPTLLGTLMFPQGPGASWGQKPYLACHPKPAFKQSPGGYLLMGEYRMSDPSFSLNPFII